MSDTKDRALRNIRGFAQQFQGARKIQRAVLGHPDGSTVRVAERPDLVYVRLKALGNALWKVFNDKVPDDYGLPVLIERRPVGDMWEIIDVDKEAISRTHDDGWSGEGLVPDHAPRHEWPDQVPGEDPVNIYPRALVPLRSYARTYATLAIQVAPYRYTYDGTFKTFWGGSIPLSVYQPSAGQSRFVLTYVDPRDNTLYATPGPVTTYSSTVVPQAPPMPTYAIPSALVRVWGGQNYVVENDIIDYRIILGMNVPDQAGGVKTPSYVVLSYTPDLPNERLLVAGTNVTITDNGPNSSVVISATGGAGGGAPTDALYLTLQADATLSDERVFTVGDGLAATDGGAGSTYTVAISLAALTEKTTTDEDDLYFLEEADNDKRSQKYETLMQEMRQRTWFFGG